MGENSLKYLNEKTIYLQMIQAAIGRMATSSAIIKGFSATILAGVSVLSYGSINWLVIVSIMPIISFMILDIYYLQLERRYRYLYDSVRNNNHEVDFEMKPPDVKRVLSCDESKEAMRIRIRSCICSWSILVFYIPVVIIYGLIILVKVGVIK